MLTPRSTGGSHTGFWIRNSRKWCVTPNSVSAWSTGWSRWPQWHRGRRVHLVSGDRFQICPPAPGFAERLFTYNYRLYDRYRRPVATLAVLADEQTRWRPERFGYALFGCRHYLEFPAVKLLDYRDQLEGLLGDPNPFALVTAAHLLTQQTRRDPEARYAAKWRLARLLYERGWEKQRVIDLYLVIDWLLRLPELLERRLWTSITTLERKKKMPYVSSAERFGIEKGEAALLRRLLTRRFGPLPEWVDERLSHAAIEDLETWGDRVLDAAKLTDVFED